MTGQFLAVLPIAERSICVVGRSAARRKHLKSSNFARETATGRFRRGLPKNGDDVENRLGGTGLLTRPNPPTLRLEQTRI